jgi:hypothetical protein
MFFRVFETPLCDDKDETNEGELEAVERGYYLG